jgi:hypothetical protein
MNRLSVIVYAFRDEFFAQKFGPMSAAVPATAWKENRASFVNAIVMILKSTTWHVKPG